MNSFGSFCDDFFVDMHVNTELDLPSERDTILIFFERIQKQFPAMGNFCRKDSGDFCLEEDRDGERFRWVTLELDRICATCSNPKDLAEAYELQRLVLELTLLRLTRPETAIDTDALVSRVERLESRVASRESQVSSGESQVASPEEESEKEEPVSPPLGGSPGGEESSIDPAVGGQTSPIEEPVEGDLVEVAHEPPLSQPPAAPPPPKGEEMEVADVTLGEFQAAWPAIVARIRTQFGARRHAFVKVAEPKSVEDGVAVLTLPAHQHFHLEQLNADGELLAALSDIAAELLGGSIDLEFRGDDSPDQPTTAEPERAPDKDRLIEEGSARDDPADLIADMLGGEVVSE